MRRSTKVAIFAVVWMGAIIIVDALDGAFGGHSAFAAFVLVVGLWEISKEVRLRGTVRRG
jgi:hypothetical protein